MWTMDVMEQEVEANVSCHLGSSWSYANDTLEILGSPGDVLITAFLGCILGIMCLIGIVGNIYTLVVVNISIRLTGSMYVYIVNLALADLLYLSTIPFVLCTYLLKDWYFGELGCRVLFSLDLLTMHASIFILTIVSTERYLAVAKPLDTMRRPRSYRKIVTCLVWLVSFFLALPTMVLIDLRTTNQNGSTKRICHATWQTEAYKVYLTVLFNTSILGPGLIIGYLYIQLARTYWRSQVAIFSVKEMKRCPRQKVFYMILIIILAYWSCFTPFWLWQLLSVYQQQPENLPPTTAVCINFFFTCLTYSNSCINPFLYTLLSKNYKEYLRIQKKNGLMLPKAQLQRASSKKSTWSGNHACTETVAIAQMEGVHHEDAAFL